MDFSIKSGHVEKQRVACLVIGVYEPRRLSETGQLVDQYSGQQLSSILRRGDIEGEMGQTLMIHNVTGIMAQRVLLVGCGRERTLSITNYRKVIGSMIEVLKNTNIVDIACYLPELNVKYQNHEWRLREAMTNINHHLYQFETLKTIKRKKSPNLKRVSFFVSSRRDLDNSDKVLARGQAISSGVKWAKDLANTPANICTPSYLAKHAQRLCHDHEHLSCTVLDEEEMEKQNMGGVLSVSRGSAEPAKFIILEYKGGAKNQAPIVLIGKGVTFDAGGISLKPSNSMDEMKYDMCGAASVLGTMKTVAELELPLNLVVLVPTTENLPDGLATKPGDIITTASGQTVEVLNTDAEGRLILADALHYAHQFNPSVVIDVATLTGACIVALGLEIAAVIGNQSVVINDLLRAGESAGDRAWQLPLVDEYQELMDSPFADMGNISNGKPGSAGTITAGCFLSRFAQKLNWAHLDIAGVAWKTGKEKGATGRPVGLLVEYLLEKVDD